MTTSQPGELLLALVAAGGAQHSNRHITSLKSSGLRWTAVDSIARRGSVVGVWRARAAKKLTRVRTTVRLRPGGHPTLLSVVAFKPGATIVAHKHAGASKGTPKVALNMRAGDVAWAIGLDAGHAAARTPLAHNTIIKQTRPALPTPRCGYRPPTPPPQAGRRSAAPVQARRAGR